MPTENEESKQPAEVETADTEEVQAISDSVIPAAKETVGEPIVPDATNIPPESDDTRSPGVQDKQETGSTTSSKPEVIRKLVVPNPTGTLAGTDDSRSPGVQDRDAIVPTSPPKEIEEGEVIREIITPPSQSESKDEPADSSTAE